MFITSNSTYGSAYRSGQQRPLNNSLYGHTHYSSLSQEAHRRMKPHLSNRNLRRVEPDSILRDYRNGRQNYYQNNVAAAPVFPASAAPCEGEEALKRVQARVQESLRKRGCLVGGSKVTMCQKPSGPIKHPTIENILPGGSATAKTSTPPKEETGMKRRQVDPQALRLASAAAQPPSLRAGEPKAAKAATEEQQFVYKDLTVEEDKENDVNGSGSGIKKISSKKSKVLG